MGPIRSLPSSKSEGRAKDALTASALTRVPPPRSEARGPTASRPAAPGFSVDAISIFRSAKSNGRLEDDCKACAKVPAGVQPKLDVSSPGDPAELEADRVADLVTTMSSGEFGGAKPAERQLSDTVEHQTIGDAINRQALPLDSMPPGEDEMEDAPVSATVNRSSDGAVGASLGKFEGSMRNDIRGGGRHMEQGTRSYMEPRFGLDFSSIRVHHDASADRLARSINARAFTHGNHVFFRQGEYQPGTSTGRRLLAHELTHTVQQRSSGPSGVHRIQRQKQARVMRAPCTDWNSFDASKTVDGPGGYNCAGLTLRDYSFTAPVATVENAIFAQGGASSVDCPNPCAASQVKYWFWKYTMHLTERGAAAPYYSGADFHIVGGTDPTSVYSKNGGRPVYGPAAGSSWRPPASERATISNRHETPFSQNGNPVTKTRTGITEQCGCFDCT